MSLHDRYLVKPGSNVHLAKIAPDDDGGWKEDDARARCAELIEELDDLQTLMYAEGKRSMLVVLQAMDAAGKDSTIRSVFGPLNAQGVHAVSFKAPTSHELAHDYLWRIHAQAPPRGHIHVFNRSHYEDVIIVRVKKLVEEKRWKSRYDQINAFEKLLADEGTVIVKFYLHISKAYQKVRLQKRLDDPKKWWKFNPDDLVERALWDDYMAAFDDAMENCSTDWAPWYIVPAQTRWYRDLVIASTLVETLRSLKMNYPKATFDPAAIHIK